jgi:uncharacterized protein YacL
MNVSLAFTRIFFTLIVTLLFTFYSYAHPEGSAWLNGIIGVLSGLAFSGLLFYLDIIMKRFNLRTFNVFVLGLFFGYLMGQALLITFGAVLDVSDLDKRISETTLEMFQMALFFIGLFLGTTMTLRAADELYVSVPFVKFSQATQKKKDLLIDSSVLSDARIIDLCATGLLDHHVIIPRFMIKELYTTVEIGDELAKQKAKRSLEVLKKLEAVPHLDVRYHDTDFPDIKDMTSKLLRLARLIDANLLTADISRIQMSSIEGVRIINLHSLSNALKPLMQTGEFIKIKIQRYGKEPRQGVGYLEDGTMVVVNGGGNFIGELIDAQVLSVKHTSSGRMIFCNALDGENHEFNESDYDQV